MTEPHNNRSDQSIPSDRMIHDLGDVPSVEIISQAAVMLMSGAAERLGLAKFP